MPFLLVPFHAGFEYTHRRFWTHRMAARGDSMNACELTALITAIANRLACHLTQDELELLGVSLTQLADTLLTISTQKSICCK